MAVELFLIEPSWENVAAYFTFSESEVTDLLKLYIEQFGDKLGSTECENSVSVKVELYNALIGSNILNINTYKNIAKSFNYSLESEDYIADLESDRLDFLIDSNVIEYTEQNTRLISSHRASTFAKYLTHHKSDYLDTLESINYTDDLASNLLDSKVFNNQERIRIVKMLDAETILENCELATKICSLLINEYNELERDCLLAVIRNAERLEDRIAVVSKTITNTPQDPNLIESLLKVLPEPYSAIAEHDRRHPMLEKNFYNTELLNGLINAGYISTYTDTEKGFRVNKKVA